MITWLNRQNQNKDFLNIGDTRMVHCTLSENCSNNKLGYKQFISELEHEIIDNKKYSFKKIDIDKQKMLINKLIKALDEPQLWFAECLTQKEHDELMLLQISCSQNIAFETEEKATSEGMNPYFDKFYEVAITHFSQDIQEAMNAIYDEYNRDMLAARQINEDIEEALYYSSLNRRAFGGV
jgi:hypothetical protein